MPEITELWLPVLLSGVAVFFLSFVMWMVLPHHRKDWAKVPDEEGVKSALGDIPSGQYMFPHCGTPEQMKDPEWIQKRDAGPTGMLIVLPRGPMNMGASMLKSFVFNLIICILVAYIASITLPRGCPDGTVLRVTATAAWLGFAGAHGWYLIWWSHSASSIFKAVFDGLVYAVAVGVLFMVFWPGV